MSRWRDIKQGNTQKKIVDTKPCDNSLKSAPIVQRIKAFVVDMFMIMMPIMYVTTYLILDGKEDFQTNNEAKWLTSLVFGIVIILFWIIKGQTPGYKAYSLKLLDDKTKGKISLPKAIFRYLIFLISATTILLAFIPFFRKDRKTFQDLLSRSTVVEEK